MKYEIIGDTSIIIDLHNGYSILAMSRWNKKELCMKVLKYVENTDFTYYVNRTKYELDCFERGNALYEKEKLNVK